ncbi:hypothetical protein DFA_06430 [Cavenderia fasciculata]|uniref:Uncharacterized protein n=1 Tax=Cavenderia fasciculata TaxID=261658 RepID=F4PIZ4_CACFS|nr:uncharacterized protein DFA_06430 [Cavenderia fasciculata]EGG24280.1 hypothetical protein DFA_06430 [Cavenderia fasciculata]|eukprot:XP_004362131.1 hypothetical protein DFA_06430 [Cavenderia fasciculata]
MIVKGPYKRKAKVQLKRLTINEAYRQLMCTDWKKGEMKAFTGSVLPWYVQTIILKDVCTDDEKSCILVSMVCWRYRRYVVETYFQEYNPCIALSISDLANHVFSRYSLYRDVKSLHLGYGRNQNLFYGKIEFPRWQDSDDEGLCGLSDQDKSVPIEVFKERFGQMIESFTLSTFHNYGHDGDGEDEQESLDASFRGEEYGSLLLGYMPQLKHLKLQADVGQLLNLPANYKNIIESIPIHQLESLTLELDRPTTSQIRLMDKLFSNVPQLQLKTLKLVLQETPDNFILYHTLSKYLMVTTTLTYLTLTKIDDHFPLLFGAFKRHQSPLKRLYLEGGREKYTQQKVPVYFCLDFICLFHGEMGSNSISSPHLPSSNSGYTLLVQSPTSLNIW